MSRNPAGVVPALTPAYSKGCIRPNDLPVACASRQMSAAHSGATALVPPTTVDCPSTSTRYPVAGSALPATSGTPRPARPVPARPGTPAEACQAGRPNVSLTPPPVAPPWAPSFQTVSADSAPVAVFTRRLVPPQASACGLDAGKSAWDLPSLTRSPLPLSPAAAVTVTPSAAASASAWSSAARAWPVQESSDWPQLMLTAVGVGFAYTAVETASTKPRSLFGAK